MLWRSRGPTSCVPATGIGGMQVRGTGARGWRWGGGRGDGGGIRRLRGMEEVPGGDGAIVLRYFCCDPAHSLFNPWLMGGCSRTAPPPKSL